MTGEFVEVEDLNHHGLRAGKWVQLDGKYQGMWALELTVIDDDGPDEVARLQKLATTIDPATDKALIDTDTLNRGLQRARDHLRGLKNDIRGFGQGKREFVSSLNDTILANISKSVAAQRTAKRKSTLLVFLMTLLLMGIGAAVGAMMGSWYIGLGSAAVLAIIMSMFAYWGGAGTIMALSGAKEIAKPDDPQLFNVVEEMTLAAGMPMPKIYLIDDSAPNAFATGRDPEHAMVAITQGLRDKLILEYTVRHL